MKICAKPIAEQVKTKAKYKCQTMRLAIRPDKRFLMLILCQGQSIIVSDTVKISFTEIKGDQVWLAIAAPQSVKIFCKEIYEQIQKAMPSAAQSTRNIDTGNASDMRLAGFAGEKSTKPLAHLIMRKWPNLPRIVKKIMIAYPLDP